MLKKSLFSKYWFSFITAMRLFKNTGCYENSSLYCQYPCTLYLIDTGINKKYFRKVIQIYFENPVKKSIMTFLRLCSEETLNSRYFTCLEHKVKGCQYAVSITANSFLDKRKICTVQIMKDGDTCEKWQKEKRNLE